MKIKLKWKVGEKPTGRYRSFHKRQWPSAEYAGTDHFAGFIASVDGRGYTPREAETAKLMVYVAIRPSGGIFQNRRLVERVVGVKAAKALLQSFIEKYPHHTLPASLRDKST